MVFIDEKLIKKVDNVSKVCGFKMSLQEVDEDNITLWGTKYMVDDSSKKLNSVEVPMMKELSYAGANNLLKDLEDFCLNKRVRDQISIQFEDYNLDLPSVE